jgi:hypothetical protein
MTTTTIVIQSQAGVSGGFSGGVSLGSGVGVTPEVGDGEAGVLVGVAVAEEEGETVAVGVGLIEEVGDEVVTGVGEAVGAELCEGDGDAVTIGVGEEVGEEVGDEEGDGEGETTGFTLPIANNGSVGLFKVNVRVFASVSTTVGNST